MILEIDDLLKIVAEINKASRAQAGHGILKVISDGDGWTLYIPEIVIASHEGIATANAAVKIDICQRLKTLFTNLSELDFEND